jgi:hypothetical protein
MANNKKGPSKQKIIVTAGIIVAIAVGLTIGLGAYYSGVGSNSDNPQPGSQDTYVPTLTANLQCNDNRSDTNAPFLHVTGTIQNIGNGTANNVKMNVYASQAGNSTAIDKTVTFDPIEAGATITVDETFDYTGETLEVCSEPTLDWTS